MAKNNDWHWTCGKCCAENREADHPRYCPCGASRRDGGTSWQDMKPQR
ncbi:hypothetical protein [Streptomyces sp. NBC_00207]